MSYVNELKGMPMNIRPLFAGTFVPDLDTNGTRIRQTPMSNATWQLARTTAEQELPEGSRIDFDVWGASVHFPLQRKLPKEIRYARLGADYNQFVKMVLDDVTARLRKPALIRQERYVTTEPKLVNVIA